MKKFKFLDLVSEIIIVLNKKNHKPRPTRKINIVMIKVTKEDLASNFVFTRFYQTNLIS